MKSRLSIIAADITAALTLLAMIPYDKDTLELINHLVPPTWIPWVIKAGIGATLTLRLINRYSHPEIKV